MSTTTQQNTRHRVDCCRAPHFGIVFHLFPAAVATILTCTMGTRGDRMRGREGEKAKFNVVDGGQRNLNSIFIAWKTRTTNWSSRRIIALRSINILHAVNCSLRQARAPIASLPWNSPFERLPSNDISSILRYKLFKLTPAEIGQSVKVQQIHAFRQQAHWRTHTHTLNSTA